MIAERLDALQQLVVDGGAGTVFEPAHPLVDQRGEIFNAIWHGRVDAEA